jgi:hypothetical protein
MPGGPARRVQAIDGGLQELMEVSQYAATLPKVVVVSDSWGVPEFASENQLDTYLSAPSVTFVAAACDNRGHDATTG